jgi:hypothetical protein
MREVEKVIFQEFTCTRELIFFLLCELKCDFVEVEKGMF